MKIHEWMKISPQSVVNLSFYLFFFSDFRNWKVPHFMSPPLRLLPAKTGIPSMAILTALRFSITSNSHYASLPFLLPFRYLPRAHTHVPPSPSPLLPFPSLPDRTLPYPPPPPSPSSFSPSPSPSLFPSLISNALSPFAPLSSLNIPLPLSTARACSPPLPPLHPPFSRPLPPPPPPPFIEWNV